MPKLLSAPSERKSLGSLAVFPLRRALFRVRGAYHLAQAVWSGADWSGAAARAAAAESDGVAGDPSAAASGRDGRIPGVVERFTREQVLGWVTVKPAHPPVVVSLFVNTRAVARTVAGVRADQPHRTGWGDIRHFEFRLTELWDYLRPGDRMSVRVDGALLPIAGRGMFRRAGKDAPETPRDLSAVLDHGQFFDPSGQLGADPP